MRDHLLLPEVETVRIAARGLLRLFLFVVHTRQAEQALVVHHQAVLVFVFYQATALNRGPRGPSPPLNPLRTRWPVRRCSSLDRVSFHGPPPPTLAERWGAARDAAVAVVEGLAED